MINKKLVIEVVVVVVILSTTGLCFYSCHKTTDELLPTVVQNKEHIKDTQKSVTNKQELKKQAIDLYSSSQYDLPLYSILEISKLPQDMKKAVNKIIEEGQGIYLLHYNKHSHKVFIIPQSLTEPNEIYSRHGLEYIELSEHNGKIEQYKASIGYSGDNGEIVNSMSGINTEEDTWEMDMASETPRPLKHTRYDSDKNVIFVEHWNYSDNPIKYEMTNANGHPMSVYKETPIKDSSYIQEHTFYDDEGKIVTSASVTSDGPNVVRFSYYNSEDTEQNVNIMSEYTNGVKTSEKIYDGNYKLLNSIVAKYDGNKRTDIITGDGTK